MAEWWEADPIAQSGASAQAADWWKNDPVAGEDPQQARRNALDAQVRREMQMSPEEFDASVREQRKRGLPYRAQPGRSISGSLFGNLMVDPLGLRDEISGAGQYVRALVGSGFDTDKAAQAYSDTADLIRAEQRVGREKYGIVPEIIGGFGTSGVGTAVKMAPTLLGRIGQSAKVGAGFGAVSGATQAEGGVAERAVGALEGGLTGAVAGPLITEVAAPAVGALARGAKAVASPVGKAVNALRGSGRNLDARLNRAIDNQNMTPRMVLGQIDDAQAASKFGKTQLDNQFTIADTGPSTRDLADTAALVSRQARGEAGEFLAGRSREQYGRINDYLKRSMQVTRSDFAATQAKLADEQQKLSKKAYDAFRDMDVRIPVGDVLYNRQIDDLAAAPELKRTLQKAREQFIAATVEKDINAPARQIGARQMRKLQKDLYQARDDLRALRRQSQDAPTRAARLALRDPLREQEDLVTTISRDLQAARAGKPGAQMVKQSFTDLTPARFDAGKRALDDMIESAMRAGRNNEARLLTRLKSELVSVADSATTLPGTTRSLYAEARDVYGSRAEMLDSLDAGRAFMRGDAEMTGAQYRKLSSGERRMFRIGVAREVRKALGSKRLGTDMVSYFDRPNVREVLGEIMTPAQSRKFYQLVELEQAMAATNQAVRGNSKTAQRQQDVLDFSLGVRLGRAIKDQGLYTALSNEIFDQITKVMAMREGDAVAVTRALLETDPVKQRETINRLIATYGKGHTKQVIDRAERIARRQVAIARRRLAGVTGEIAAGPQEQSQPIQTAP